MDNKECKKCGKVKELSEYYSQKQKRANGREIISYHPKCKQCMSEEYQENKEEINRKDKERRLRNPETSRNSTRNYRIRNLEKVSADQRKWRQEHPDKLKEYNSYRLMNKKHEITSEQWENCKNYFNYRCAYCELKLEEHYITYKDKEILGDFHKEHVDHNGSNDLSNCVPSCKSCNGQKNTIPFFEWYSPDNEKFESDMFDKILKWLVNDYKLYIQ